MLNTSGHGVDAVPEEVVLPLRVVLTGFRATGKSAVGSVLARLIGYRFIDMDGELGIMLQASISDFVSEHGWPAFRQKERELLGQLACMCHVVIATGGGAVLHAQEWKELRKSSLVVWLQADAQVIRERLHSDPVSNRQRPSLSGRGTHDEVEAVLAEREPLYRAGSDMAIHTMDKSPEEIAALIRDHIIHTEHA